MNLADLLATIDQLPLDQQEKIQQHIQENKAKQKPDVPNQRIPGLGRGTIWMSEDFNDELPDEFWLGEE